VREAYDGKQGYARIEEKTPAYQKVPILMLTSFPKKMMEEGSEKFQHLLGEYWPVAQFLEKPVEPRELLSAVESLIARTQAPPENVLDPAP
jgi:DNA-binding response OmpR family regulator